ncbi:hypothetical protein GW17_00059262 [Ensete ventricosum]|nr:hypothetical protein GW17_00059262 [Ensete ventricosum]
MSYEHGFTKKHDVHKVTCKVKFRSIFHAPSWKFKILAIPNVFAHEKSYELGFVKKYDGHKLCAKSSFDQFFVHRLSRKFKILTIPNILAHAQKFTILAIPNVLAHGKSYKHGFTKKLDGHKLCAKSRAESSIDRFFVHHLEN